MRDQLTAALSLGDPAQVQDMLFEVQPFGDGVREERQKLEGWLATLLDQSVNELADLLESRDFEVVAAAVEKYKQFPPPVVEPWEKLRLHMTELVYRARSELQVGGFSDSFLWLKASSFSFKWRVAWGVV